MVDKACVLDAEGAGVNSGMKSATALVGDVKSIALISELPWTGLKFTLLEDGRRSRRRL